MKIEVNEISKVFGEHRALNGVSFKAEAGQIRGIIGENGAGKTTLIRCLTGIYRPDDGEVLADGQPVYDNPAVKEKIGYVADGNQFFLYYTVKMMVDFFAGMYPKFSMDRFGELNEIFGVPMKKPITQLSKGAQVRVALMLSIALRPELLVLDEPTAGLDPIAKSQLLGILAEEAEVSGVSIIISSHQLDELERLCDRMCILQSGKLIYDTDIDAIKQQVKKYQAVFKHGKSIDGLPGIISADNVGKLYSIVTESGDEGFAAALSGRCSFFEELPLSLNEIFIYLNKRRVGQ